jgi:hypothetical protein
MKRLTENKLVIVCRKLGWEIWWRGSTPGNRHAFTSSSEIAMNKLLRSVIIYSILVVFIPIVWPMVIPFWMLVGYAKLLKLGEAYLDND